MEHIKKDPELAEEMVQLMSKKIKALQKRNQELEVRVQKTAVWAVT